LCVRWYVAELDDVVAGMKGFFGVLKGLPMLRVKPIMAVKQVIIQCRSRVQVREGWPVCFLSSADETLLHRCFIIKPVLYLVACWWGLRVAALLLSPAMSLFSALLV
jgi:hypothetical protein